MSTLKVKNLILEPGRPKVAVPIVAEAPADIIAACEAIRELPCDMIEWRADHYLSTIENLDEWLEDKNAYLDIMKILDDLEFIAAGKPIIFTIRSTGQGGKVQVSRPQLENIYSLVVQSGLADFTDIELCDKDGAVREDWLRQQMDEIHKYGGKVILSHHETASMPEPGKIVETVKKMYALGADLCKFAAMANSREDAETLLKATAYLNQNWIGPLIMIAMGEEGKTARVAAGKYGSCITFAAGEASSAPGQPDVHTMKKWLDDYYGAVEQKAE